MTIKRALFLAFCGGYFSFAAASRSRGFDLLSVRLVLLLMLSGAFLGIAANGIYTWLMSKLLDDPTDNDNVTPS